MVLADHSDYSTRSQGNQYLAYIIYILRVVLGIHNIGPHPTLKDPTLTLLCTEDSPDETAADRPNANMNIATINNAVIRTVHTESDTATGAEDLEYNPSDGHESSYVRRGLNTTIPKEPEEKIAQVVSTTSGLGASLDDIALVGEEEPPVGSEEDIPMGSEDDIQRGKIRLVHLEDGKHSSFKEYSVDPTERICDQEDFIKQVVLQHYKLPPNTEVIIRIAHQDTSRPHRGLSTARRQELVGLERTFFISIKHPNQL